MEANDERLGILLAHLSAGIDSNSAALVQCILRFVADRPELIFVTQSIELARSRRRAEQFTAQALAIGDATQRTEIANQLIAAAEQSEQQPGAPWRALAGQLGDV